MTSFYRVLFEHNKSLQYVPALSGLYRTRLRAPLS